MRHPPPGLPSRRPARPQAARTGPGESLWYLDAVIYQLNVKAFFDSNDDGVGDFNGVTARLDHVKDLGVNTIWLMPFYPSPLRDDGYDISDYLDVHPHYGTLDDFRRLLDEAHRRDLRVITELVINHTSDQHPWFQRARKAPPGSPERDFYVWSDTDDRYRGTRIIFTDTETSNWTYDPVAKAYFWHRFFSHQPDLNFDNPQVLEAIFETMRFWLDMGVDGFRLDAIPYLVEREGTNNENLPETHAIIRKLRAAIDASYPNRFLLAEANQWPEDVCEYFGDGDECHAAYHFPLMPRMYMAIAQEDRFPLTEIMQQTPAIPSNCQWAIFLRNHDELTLEMVTSKERDYMYSTYAADPRARINLGIRRRLAPLMDNDTDRIKLMNSLLLSMRGSPIIYYGDEIGMGDNVFVGDRNGVRTPMQWSPDRNAGFSRADPQRLYLPPIMDAVYGYEALNVEAQQREPASLLNWMRRMLAVRATSKAFGRGELLFLRPGNRKILAYLRTWRDDEQGQDEVILCVVNLARSAQPVELDLSAFRGRVPVEMLGRTAFPPIGDLPYLLTIAAHGFYWFRLSSDTAVPNWHQSFTPVEERSLLVLFDGWNSLFRDQVVPWRIGMAVQTRAQFENAVLPSHVAAQRWHGPKGGVPQRAEMVDDVAWTRGADTWLLPLLRLHGATAAADSVCFLPLALAWEDGDEERYRAFSSSAVARVRQQAEVGVMADAFADERFCRALAEAIGDGLSLPTRTGTLRFLPTRAHAALAGAGVRDLPVQRAQAQGRHTLVALGDRLVLKAYRQAVAGRNPEFEIGRFLTEDAGFQAIAPVAGALEHVGADGVVRTLCLLQAHVSNQGDAWTMMVGSLQRHFEDVRSRTEPLPVDVHGAHLALTETLGRRAGELHLALAHAGADAAFTPEPLLETDHEAERREVAATARDAFAALEAALGGLDDETRSKARGLLDARASVMARIDAFTAPEPARLKTRIHGDFHLAQVLVTRNDFVIVGFEGDPALPVPQRRRKHSPMRDVAAMLRSFAHVHASAQRAVAPTADEAAAFARAGRAWEAATRSAFLNGYVSAAGDGVLYPPGFDPDRTQLPLFEWHRALVELSMALTDAGPHDESGSRQAAVPAALDAILGLLATRALPAPAGRKEV